MTKILGFQVLYKDILDLLVRIGHKDCPFYFCYVSYLPGMKIELEKTPDIAAALGKLKKGGQMTVGFALETNNERANAKSKLDRKNFDMIVLNSLRDKGAGFNFDTNKITILRQDNIQKEFELKSKAEVAEDIVAEILLMQNKK